MQYESFLANDGCQLSFQSSIPLEDSFSVQKIPNKLIILIHGFSGSSEYFTRNFSALSASNSANGDNTGGGHWVVAPDLRGHGASGRPKGGYHVARLAVDLQNLIAHLREVFDAQSNNQSADLQIVAVGCSIGAAILWTYTELFTCSDFSGLVFVDQAPLQDALFFRENDPDNWGPTEHHTGCYNETTLQAAQRAWMLPKPEIDATYKALVDECLGYRQQASVRSSIVTTAQADKDLKFFSEISSQCDGKWLARLMADHTRYDHREAIESIDVPTLVMAGRLSGCFRVDGMLETARRIQASGREDMKWKVAVSIFEDSGHWLFYETPDRFNREILEFVGQWTK